MRTTGFRLAAAALGGDVMYAQRTHQLLVIVHAKHMGMTIMVYLIEKFCCCDWKDTPRLVGFEPKSRNFLEIFVALDPPVFDAVKGGEKLFGKSPFNYRRSLVGHD